MNTPRTSWETSAPSATCGPTVCEEPLWQAIAGLLQEPEALREELKRHREEGSPTREAAEQELRMAELERQLARLQVTQEQEARALAFAQRVRDGLERLDFAGRQLLLRLVVEDVTCNDDQAVVHTTIRPLPRMQRVNCVHPLEGG